MEDADVEHLALGSPKTRPQANSTSGTIANSVEEDEDDDLAKELEAALEEEDERQDAKGVGLGISGQMGVNTGAQVLAEDESEVSEEE